MDAIEHLNWWFNLRPLESVVRKIQTPFLKKLSKEFQANIRRVHSTAHLPFKMVGVAGRMQACYCKARFAQRGKHNETRVISGMIKLLREQQNEDLANKMKPFNDSTNPLWNIMHLHYRDKEVDKSLHRLRELNIITTWSAIESCLNAIWESMVETMPHVRDRSGQPQRIPTLFQKKINSLAPPHIYSNRGKERLKSTAVIREAFSRGIHVNSNAVDESLSSLELEALAIVRHVIVHQLGRMDDDYIKRSRPLPLLKGIPRRKGAHLNLSGEHSSLLIAGALTAFCNVLTSLDDWIETNP